MSEIKLNFCLSGFQGSRAEQERLLRYSTTIYVGNLSFYTTEEQIYELFTKCGDVKRIVMGLDKYKKTPCGFCFVEYPLLSCLVTFFNLHMSFFSLSYIVI